MTIDDDMQSHAERQRMIEEQTRTFKFTYRSLDFPTKAAKRLKRCMEALTGAAVTIGRARAIVAQLAGYASWVKLQQSIDPDSSDRIDQDLDAEELSQRRTIQERRLLKLTTVHQNSAGYIISIVEPTGSATGMLRWDDGAFFEFGRFQVGANAWDALKADAARYPSFRKLLCLDLERDVFRVDDADVAIVEAEYIHGIGIEVSISGIPHLRVEYVKEIDLDFGFRHNPFLSDDPEYVPHPRPLRPDVAEKMDVSYKLSKVVIQKKGRGLETAFHHAAGFILFDLLQTTSMCAQSIQCEIQTMDPSIDTNFDDEEWLGLSEVIAGFYEEVLAADEELSDDPDIDIDLENGWCLLRDVAPFPDRIVLTDE